MILSFEAEEIRVINHAVSVDGIDIDDLYEKVKAIKEDLEKEEE
jgi:DNA-binding transcriptional MocR family regulator